MPCEYGVPIIRFIRYVYSSSHSTLLKYLLLSPLCQTFLTDPGGALHHLFLTSPSRLWNPEAVCMIESDLEHSPPPTQKWEAISELCSQSIVSRHLYLTYALTVSASLPCAVVSLRRKLGQVNQKEIMAHSSHVQSHQSLLWLGQQGCRAQCGVHSLCSTEKLLSLRWYFGGSYLLAEDLWFLRTWYCCLKKKKNVINGVFLAYIECLHINL